LPGKEKVSSFPNEDFKLTAKNPKQPAIIRVNKRGHTMNKAELVEEAAGKVGLTKKETNNVVEP